MLIPALNGKIVALNSQIGMQSAYANALAVKARSNGGQQETVSVANQTFMNVTPTSSFTVFAMMELPAYACTIGYVPLFGSVGSASGGNGYWGVMLLGNNEILIYVLKDGIPALAAQKSYPGGSYSETVDVTPYWDFYYGYLTTDNVNNITPSVTNKSAVYSIAFQMTGSLHGYKLYINGLPIALTGFNSNLTTGGTLNNGGSIDFLPQYNWVIYGNGLLVGYLRHASYYTTVLTSAQILNLSNTSGNASTLYSPSFYYRFDATSGTNVKDYSGNGYDITLANFNGNAGNDNTSLGSLNAWRNALTLSPILS